MTGLGADVRSLLGLLLLKRDILREHSQGLIQDAQLLEELAVVEESIEGIRRTHWSREVVIELARGFGRLGPGLVLLLLVIVAGNLFRWLG